MKLHSVLGMLIVSATSISAFAADQTVLSHDKEKILKIDVLCKFEKDHYGLTGGHDEDQDDKNRCFAAATLFKKQKDDGGGYLPSGQAAGGDAEDGKTKNRFAVLCKKTLIYADGAEVKKRGDDVRIQGIPGPTPAVVLDLDDKEDGHEKEVRARLELKREELKGSCKIRVKEWKDED